MDLSAAEKMIRPTSRKCLIAVSLASLCFIPAWRQILDPAAKNYYYFIKVSAARAELSAMTCNLALVTLLLLPVTLLALRPVDSHVVKLARVAFLLVALIPLNALRVQFPGLLLSHFVEQPGWMLAVALSLPVAALCVFIYLRFVTFRLVSVAAALLLILSPFTLVAYAQALWLSVKYGEAVRAQKPLAAPLAAPQAVASGAGRTRVLWLIFDEMDRRVAFKERPETLALPEFDRLRDASLIALHARPPAMYTVLSLPSLLLGRVVTAAEPVSPQELSVKFYGSNEKFGWSTQPNIFTRAREAGYNTAVVGWYHPYCRLFGGELTRCYWDSAKGTGFEDPESQNTLHQMLRQAELSFLSMPLLHRAWRTRERKTENLLKARAATYLGLLEEAKRDAADPELGLVVVHLSVPHPPSFYNRAIGDFSFNRPDNYLDGLALADRALGEIRREMEKAGLWDNTVVLVSADHWWRAEEIWDPSVLEVSNARWSDENNLIAKGEADRRGVVDRRVPFILKFAGQKDQTVYAQPFNTVLSHDLLLSILRGEISSPQDVVRWLEQDRGSG